MGVGAGEVGPGISAPAGGGGPGSPGTSTLRAFPFAFDTPGLATAAALYTPTIGDILLDAWIEIDTAWNGTTPTGDVGLFVTGPVGWIAQFSGIGVGIPMTQADDPAEGLLLGDETFASSLSLMNAFSAAYGVLQVPAIASVPSPQISLTVPASSPYLNASRLVPGKFVAANPIKVVVSQDGTNLPTQAGVTSANPATVPLTVVAGVNDEFVFTGPALGVGGAGTPETFTVAPGTYSTLAALAAAMQAATGAVHPTFLNFTGNATGYKVSASGGTNLLVSAAANNVNGAGDNGDTITPGTHDFTAAAGFANPTTFGSGTGGDPGSTQGAGILYLLTATPL